MITGKCYATTIWLFLVILVLQLGCAHTPASPPEVALPLLSEEIRAQLGTIGVVSALFAPEAERHKVKKKWQSGAALGALTGLLAAAQGREVGALLSPLLILGGAIHGGATAESTKEIHELEVELKSVVAESKTQQAIRDRLMEVAREQTSHRFMLFTEQGPTSPYENVSYPPLETEGIDTILEMSVLTVGLTGQGDRDVPLAFFVTARTRLIRVMDEAEFHTRTWTYTSGTRQLTEWAAENAQPFREEMDRACQNLAEMIVRELLFSSPSLQLVRMTRPD